MIVYYFRGSNDHKQRVNKNESFLASVNKTRNL